MKPEQDRQREITRLCAQAGLLLMQHGAESALVETVMRRVGLAFNLESVEVAIMANAITVTTLDRGWSTTTVRRNEDRGINMAVLIEVQRVLIRLEQESLSLEETTRLISAIKPYRHPRWLTVVFIGFSCACFARLAHADWPGCAVVFVASSVAMAARQQFAHLHLSPLVTFFLTAFVATSISAQALVYRIGETPKVAMAASCLLLVPGVPLINGVSDMVKGYINTGISRMAMAMLLSIATCTGIVLAMNVWGAWAWL
ncbi:threonine/serine exporter ThrE family protein [Nibricoccus sp. IMCC34717]|uniref:threonine/serine ThrE exporter family protein n=1 Tax=Nibricoccus sp. IMCC34717 TaxID=3034021 RepID=UPI00384C302B